MLDSPATNKNKKVETTFWDFRTTFDLANYKILLSKLVSYGFSGPAGTWVLSYLCNKTQYVEVMFKKYSGRSNTELFRMGVPQGSILGPLFFIIYNIDLLNLLRPPPSNSYADDTTLVTVLNSNEALWDLINKAFS